MKIALDIETLQASKEEWADLQGVSLLPDQTGVSSSDLDEKHEKEFQKSAFDGTFSRIICIGILFFSNDMKPLKLWHCMVQMKRRF